MPVFIIGTLIILEIRVSLQTFNIVIRCCQYAYTDVEKIISI